MPNTATVRATLSDGDVVCTVRRYEALTDDEWIAVRVLAEAVRVSAAALNGGEKTCSS